MDRLNTFLDQYNASVIEKEIEKAREATNSVGPFSNPTDCTWESLKEEKFKPGASQYCKIDKSQFLKETCTREKNYGFPEGSPCILLKLNKIYGWKPKPYKNHTYIPSEAPKQLKDFAIKWETEHPDRVGHMIWLSCEGENPADIENVGPINYYPHPGIPTFYFPYKNQIGYKSPIVFAHLEKPKKGVLIAIECKGWAENIKHDETKMERIGSVHFEILID